MLAQLSVLLGDTLDDLQLATSALITSVAHALGQIWPGRVNAKLCQMMGSHHATCCCSAHITYYLLSWLGSEPKDPEKEPNMAHGVSQFKSTSE